MTDSTTEKVRLTAAEMTEILKSDYAFSLDGRLNRYEAVERIIAARVAEAVAAERARHTNGGFPG